MLGFLFVLRLKCSRLTRFDHQFCHESKITGCDCMVGISLSINTSRSFDMQMWPLLFTDKKSISSLSNNSDCSNCISIVSKQTQSEILLLPLGYSSSILILRDQSWWWAFATSFPGHCTRKVSWVPHFPWATLFNESMQKKCVSNLNLHLILNILQAISSPPWRWNRNNGTHLRFPPVPLLPFHLWRFCSVFLLGDKSLTYNNKHNSYISFKPKYLKSNILSKIVIRSTGMKDQTLFLGSFLSSHFNPLTPKSD